MKFFYIEPEVAGDLGDCAILDPSIHPPRIDRLHYEFDIWPEDCLLETFPCLIATKEAAVILKTNDATGVLFDEVEVSITEDLQDSHPDRKLPPFVWLRVTGIAGKDDFGVADDFRFVISGRVLDILRPFGLAHADIESFPSDGTKLMRAK